MLPQIIQSPTTFDYSALSGENAELAKRVADKIRSHHQRTVAEIISIGAELIQVRAAVGHGHFGQWIAAEFAWTDRTARNYIQAAERFGSKSETVSVLPPTAVYLLSAKSTPSNIVESVVSKLETGEPVDLGIVQAQVETARRNAKDEKEKRLLRRNRTKIKKAQKQYELQRQELIAERVRLREQGEIAARELIADLGLVVLKRVLVACEDVDTLLAIERAIEANGGAA